MLNFDALPRDDNGVLQGTYRVHVEGVDIGITETSGLELEQLHAAWGSELLIEPPEEQRVEEPVEPSPPVASAARPRPRPRAPGTSR